MNAKHLSLTLMVHLNLKGGPSRKVVQLSSLPVTRRYGRVCLMSTVLMILLWPTISPTDEPVSQRNTAPNLHGHTQDTVSALASVWLGAWRVPVTHFSRPSPTTAILLLSSVQAMSLIFPPNGWYSYFSRCSFCVVSQIRIFPDTSGWEREHSQGPEKHSDGSETGRHSPPDAM